VSSDGKTGNGSSLGPSISSAGRRVVFWSAADNLVKGADGHDPDVYLHSVATERTTILTAAGEGATAQTGDSGQSINGDGRRVAYELIESPIGGALEYHYLVRISPPEPCSGWTGLTTEGWPTI
jgi:hypothetical protein